jgi:uncharacterized protein YjdB
MKKRFISLLFCLVFLLSFSPSTALAEDGATEIYTTADLYNIRNDLGGYYKLMRDIAFTEEDFSPDGAYHNGGDFWQPMGSGSITDDSAGTPFSGTLDGNGFAITGLKISRPMESYIGLFAAVSGTVKDLAFDGSDIFGYKYVGAVCGLLKSGGVISGCTQSGLVEGSDDAGGMAGYAASGTIFENCANSGDVSGNNTYGAGIVGEVISYTDQTSPEIKNCSNTGNISAGVWPGGIVGNLNNGMITNCTNYGRIYSPSDAGGIVGGNTSTTDRPITGCANYGQVNGGLSGGIAGQHHEGLILQCANYANIQMREGSISGGITGLSQGFIRECLNAGNLSRGGYLGGITGLMSGGVIRDCYNTGNLTLTYDMNPVGGIAGQITGSGRNIINCYNTGVISQGTNSGDIVGERKKIGYSENAYYLKEDGAALLYAASKEGTPKTLAQMCNQSTYTGFDFSTVWEGAAAKTPKLKNIRFIYPTGVSATASVTLYPKKTATLSVKVSPSNATNKNMLYKSSNPSVATVSATGKVTGIKAGTAVITIISTASQNIKATCKVTVINQTVPKAGAAEAVLSKTAVKKVVFKGSVVSDGGLSVTERGFVIGLSKSPAVGKSGVIRIKSGSGVGSFQSYFTSLKAGKTYYVRAYAKNSKGIAYGAEKQFKTYVPVTKITLKKTSLSLAGGASYALKVKSLSPKSPTNKAVAWASSNTKYATVSASGYVTIKPGNKGKTVVITCTAKDGGGAKAKCTIKIK